jgi:hypothetical protein
VKRRGDNKPNYDRRDCGIRNSDFYYCVGKESSGGRENQQEAEDEKGLRSEKEH